MNYLIVADQTLGGEALRAAVLERQRRGPSRFHLVVPARRDPRGLTWTEGRSRADADRRLAEGLRWMTSLGLEATGEVGDEDPIEAAGDALRGVAYHELLLSTLPAGISRWLRQDVPARLRRRVRAWLDVTVVVSNEERLLRQAS
jgi:hypothetical protein